MKIKLEDFEIKKWYGFQTNNGETTIVGSIIAKGKIDSGNGEKEFLEVYTRESRTLSVNINDIECYWSFNEPDSDTQLFDPELVAYSIQPGETITEILKSYINKWDDYDEKTRKMLASKVSGLIGEDVLVDLLTAYVDTKKYYKEECEKHLRILDNQAEFVKKYSEFKSVLPDGIAKIYDMIIFDICGLDLS